MSNFSSLGFPQEKIPFSKHIVSLIKLHLEEATHSTEYHHDRSESSIYMNIE